MTKLISDWQIVEYMIYRGSEQLREKTMNDAGPAEIDMMGKNDYYY